MIEDDDPRLTPYRALIERCDNWADCLRWRQNAAMHIGPGMGGNVSKMYFPKERGFYTSSPQIWEAVPTPRPEPDQHDADAIEHAVCALDLFHHGVLRYHHIAKLAPAVALRIACRMSGVPRVHPAAWIVTRAEAYALLQAMLAQPAVVRKQRALDRVMAALKGNHE